MNESSEAMSSFEEDEPPPSERKYENYRDLMGRFEMAKREGFLLEAVFIEYAVIEDRLLSAIAHSGGLNSDKASSITDKLNKVEKLCENRRGIARDYFGAELLAAIRAWKDRRNGLVHKLMETGQGYEGFEPVVREGEVLMKTLKSKVGSYNRAIDKARSGS